LNGGGGLLIDTNLLMLLVVGSTRRELIGRHKRVREFTLGDYDLLVQIISVAPHVLVTPNTLTETSNLLAQIEEPARGEIRAKFREIIEATEESYITSKTATTNSEYLRLGLTDAALLQLCPGAELLTTDLQLYLAALDRGAKAVNFNHLREQLGTI
jgi:hypothetical protein